MSDSSHDPPLQTLHPQGVSYYGPLAQVTHEGFVAAVVLHGGRYVRYAEGAAFALLVLGEAELPVTASGDPVNFGGRAVMAEGAFFVALGERPRPDDAAGADHAFTTRALADLLRVPEARLLAWAKAGLLRPRAVDHGVMRFDFRQASVARTLVGLVQVGVGIAKLRRSITQLGRWLPDMHEPLQQLSVLERNGPLLVRLESGELAEVDGQLRLDFDAERKPPPQPLPLFGGLVPRPRTAADFHEQGVSQELAGLWAAAADSYRRALREGGPDAQVCFDLAHVLAALGQKEQAAERYRQVTEIDPRRADAWNNLGVVLADLGQLEEAVEAFRQAVHAGALDADAQYNLADPLDDTGADLEAAEQFRRYLKLKPFPSPRADHARDRATRGS